MTVYLMLNRLPTRLLALICNGLHLHAERSTALNLGDRNQYIGLSDIGRALECPRAALLNKVMPRAQGILSRELTLQRGHWLEHGIGQAFTAQNLRMFSQLELSILFNGIPVKAHMDFVLVWGQPRSAVRILELKSTERLPDTLYTSYECQLYGQAGLMARFWNEPVFNLRDDRGTVLHQQLTMPELCKAHLGLTLPTEVSKVNLEAWVLCLSMSDARPFGPYLPNDVMSDVCLNTAQTLWENKLDMKSGQLDANAMACASGFHPLCAYCDWNADCPKFHDGEHQPEWQADMVRLQALKEARDDLDAEIEELERGLKDAYALSGMAGDWINTGSWRFRVSQHSGRRTLSRDMLRLELLDALGDERAAEKLISWCEVEGKPYTRLTINPVNSHEKGRALPDSGGIAS